MQFTPLSNPRGLASFYRAAFRWLTASAASPGLSEAEPSDSFCSLCLLPRGRIPLARRIRSWMPPLLSGCCARS